MLNRRIKKIITCLVITLSIGTTFMGGHDKVLAMPATSVSQAELDKNKNMTLEQLKAIAKPMPQNAIRTVIDNFGTTNYLKANALLPEDGNIYYIESTWNNGMHFQTFYKFLYAVPEEQNTIAYHVYTWDYGNDKLDHNGEYSSAELNESLYKELYDALLKDKDSKSTPSTGGSTTPSSNQNNGNSNSGSNSSDGNSNNTKKYTKKRLGGATRIETSKIISEELYNSTVENVVVSNGYGFADALSGSVLANKLNAPVLLTGTTVDDSSVVFDYIQKHLNKNGTIYVLGGEASVNSTIINKFTEMGYSNIKRLAGQNRYETNQAINNNLNVVKGTPIVIVNGQGFADALSISSIASSNGYPIVLTDTDSLSEQAIETVKNLQPSQVYVIGGVGAVSEGVKEQIKSLASLSDDKITRIAGSTRYETSLNIAKYFNLDTDTVVFANGEGFADALSGSVLAAKHKAPTILVNGDISAQKTYIDTTKYTNEILLGGTGSISDDIENSLSK